MPTLLPCWGILMTPEQGNPLASSGFRTSVQGCPVVSPTYWEKHRAAPRRPSSSLLFPSGRRKLSCMSPLSCVRANSKDINAPHPLPKVSCWGGGGASRECGIGLYSHPTPNTCQHRCEEDISALSLGAQSLHLSRET